MYKTSRLVRICLLISTLNKRVLLFFSGKLFYKSNRKLFSCVFLAWYKHSRGWENSRQLRKTETKSRVYITVSNSPILGDPGAVGRAGRKGATKVFKHTFVAPFNPARLTAPGSPRMEFSQPLLVYVRLCKHGKRFLLLKLIPQGNVWRSVLIQARIHTGFHRFTSLRMADVSPRSSPLIMRNVSRGGNVPQRRRARRNVCRSQANVLRKSVRFFIINILYYKKNFPSWKLENGLENVFSQFPGIRHAMRFSAGKSLVKYPVWMTQKPRK